MYILYVNIRYLKFCQEEIRIIRSCPSALHFKIQQLQNKKKEFYKHNLKKYNKMANRGYWFQKQVGKYLRASFGKAYVKSEVPMNKRQADFVVNVTQVWEAKSQPRINQACIDQLVATAKGKKAILVLAIGKDATVPPAVQQYATANNVEIIRMLFN